MRRFRLLFCFLLCLAPTLPVWAQNPTPTPDNNPVKMTVDSPTAVTRTPLSVATRLGRWFPLAVTLSNTGDAVTGTLSLQLFADPQGNPSARPVSEFVTTVDLPANQSNKRVWLYGRVEREDCSAAQVVFSGRGIETRRFTFDLSDTGVGTRTVLTISDADERLSYLSSFRDPMLGLRDVETDTTTNRYNPNPTLVRTLGATHDMVPTRWIGFDLVDCVVLHDFPHTALSPAQLNALRGYVSGGGTLVVFGGAGWQRLASSPLRGLWPVVPTGSNVATAAETANLVQRYVTHSPLRGEDKLGSAPILMARGPVAPHGRVLDGTAPAPILTVKDFGAGRVVMLSYDPTLPPFSGWSGQQELWKDVFELSPRPPRLDAVTDGPNFDSSVPNYGNYQNTGPTATTQLESDLAATPQLKTPPVSSIAWFLALYVFFLVPVNYCVLRAIDKREWAWITVPVIVAAFSALAYMTALRIKGRDLLSRRVEIVRAANGATLARADTALWLFSPRKTAYDLVASDARYVIAPRIKPGDAGGSNVEIIEPDESKPISVSDAAVQMWDNRTFMGATTLDMGAGISVSRDNSGGMSVYNGSKYTLQGAVIVSDGDVFPVGEVAAGKTKTASQGDGIHLRDQQLIGRIQIASQLSKLFPATGSETPSSIASSALKLALGQNFGARPMDGSLLIAWGRHDQPITSLRIADEAPRERSVTLFVVRAGDLKPMSSEASVAGLGAPAIENISTGAGKPDRRRYTWETYLPAGIARHALQLTASGHRGGYYQNGYPYSSGGVTSGLPATTWEIWNWQSHAWQPIHGRLKEPKPRPGYQDQNSSWSFLATIPSTTNLLRHPDNLLRLRALAGDTTVRDFSLSLKPR